MQHCYLQYNQVLCVGSLGMNKAVYAHVHVRVLVDIKVVTDLLCIVLSPLSQDASTSPLDLPSTVHMNQE